MKRAQTRAVVILLVILLGGAVLAHRAQVAAAWRQPSPEQASSTGVYTPAAGPYEAESVNDLVLHDAKRNKDLHLKVTYPKADGTFPVIVFSHGWGGSKDTYAGLTRYWAEHGYVTLQPTHDDSWALRRKSAAGTSPMMGIGGRVAGDINDPQQWANRTRDISFVMDSLGEIERDVPGLKGKLDKSRVGVGGHSFGALTTMLIGGASVTPRGASQPETFGDPRARALLVLSGSGPGQMGLDQHSWDNVTAPLMVMTGTRDVGLGFQGPAWRKKSYEWSKSDVRYFILLDGGTHMTFTGMPAQSGREPAILFETVKTASLAFWDAYVRDSEGARTYLNSSALADFAGGKAEVERH
jgi:predicted dienelactone hydrolase